jgi:hypothetical protein
MSESSPSDLAVTFRSIDRRLGEALEPVAGLRTVATAEIAQLDGLVAEAAGLLHADATTASVAEVLEDRPADAWAQAELDTLRRLALEAGQLLRKVGTLAEQHAARSA